MKTHDTQATKTSMHLPYSLNYVWDTNYVHLLMMIISQIINKKKQRNKKQKKAMHRARFSFLSVRFVFRTFWLVDGDNTFMHSPMNCQNDTGQIDPYWQLQEIERKGQNWTRAQMNQ